MVEEAPERIWIKGNSINDWDLSMEWRGSPLLGWDTEYTRADITKSKALDELQKEVEGYLPEFGAGDPQDGTDLIIDQCWRDFRKIILRLKGQ